MLGKCQCRYSNYPCVFHRIDFLFVSNNKPVSCRYCALLDQTRVKLGSFTCPENSCPINILVDRFLRRKMLWRIRSDDSTVLCREHLNEHFPSARRQQRNDGIRNSSRMRDGLERGYTDTRTIECGCQCLDSCKPDSQSSETARTIGHCEQVNVSNRQIQLRQNFIDVAQQGI